MSFSARLKCGLIVVCVRQYLCMRLSHSNQRCFHAGLVWYCIRWQLQEADRGLRGDKGPDRGHSHSHPLHKAHAESLAASNNRQPDGMDCHPAMFCKRECCSIAVVFLCIMGCEYGCSRGLGGEVADSAAVC